MDMGDDMGDMSGMGGMVMTFGSFKDYELQIVWNGWDVKTKGQFALSWFAVMLMTIAYQGFKFWFVQLESRIVALRSKRNGSGDENKGIAAGDSPLQVEKGTSGMYETLTGTSNGAGTVPFKYLLLHAGLSALNYGVALILMLIAMTYNPSLFVALMVGYFLGDLIFFKRSLSPAAGYDPLNTNYQAAGDCH
jgi:hypothetical protein